jgi:hypothetical protein
MLNLLKTKSGRMDTPAHTPQPMDIGRTYSRSPNLRPTITDFPIDMPDI